MIVRKIFLQAPVWDRPEPDYNLQMAPTCACRIFSCSVRLWKMDLYMLSGLVCTVYVYSAPYIYCTQQLVKALTQAIN